MKFEQALSESNDQNKQVLTEGFRRYMFKYKGSRPWYTIHDKNPFVLAIDDNYNVDGNGKSLLGINMHYFADSPYHRNLFNKINNFDNAHGFKGFDVQTIIDRKNTKNKREFDKKIADLRKERYFLFRDNFPMLMPYLRRYKYSAIQNMRRTKEDVGDVWKNYIKAREGD